MIIRNHFMNELEDRMMDDVQLRREVNPYGDLDTQKQLVADEYAMAIYLLVRDKRVKDDAKD